MKGKVCPTPEHRTQRCDVIPENVAPVPVENVENGADVLSNELRWKPHEDGSIRTKRCAENATGERGAFTLLPDRCHACALANQSVDFALMLAQDLEVVAPCLGPREGIARGEELRRRCERAARARPSRRLRAPRELWDDLYLPRRRRGRYGRVEGGEDGSNRRARRRSRPGRVIIESVVDARGVQPDDTILTIEIDRARVATVGESPERRQRKHVD